MAARWANAAARVGQFQNVEGALYDNQDEVGDERRRPEICRCVNAPCGFQARSTANAGLRRPGPTAPPGGGFAYPPGGHPCPLDASIATDVVLGQKIPVQATPTYVITYKGNRLPAASGAVSWAILKQFFDSLLAQ